MHPLVRFPYGRFTEAEWRAAQEDVYWRGLLSTLEAAFGRGGEPAAPGV